MATPGKCPQAATVARLIDGELNPEERAELEAHIASCNECYRVLTESTEVWWRIGDRPNRDDESG